MDWLLAFWMVCLVSPVLAWVRRRVRLRAKNRPRKVVPSAGFVATMPRRGQSVEKLLADLTRLERDFARLDTSDAPNKMMRLRALSLAYDDVLCECCAALGLPAPQSRPLDSVDRLQTECDLVQHGLTW